jgi:parvulin-like peptidyl-prolyl isomerase
MKSSYRSAFFLILVFVAMAASSGCAKHPSAVERVTPPAAETTPALESTNRGVEEKQVTGPVESDPRKIVVAKVNGVELHMDALVNMMNRLASQVSSTTPEALEEHRKRSLDKLITQELAFQQAKAQGISIGAEKINLAIKNLKENLGGEKEFADYLAKMNVTEADLRAEVERGLTLETIYYREVLGKVTVPEDEVKQEYEKEKARYIVPETAKIIDVVVLMREGVDSSKKAKELLGKLRADKDKDPWKLFLDGTFIVRELRVNNGKEKELLDAAKKLKPNQLSGMIDTPMGTHIIKLIEYSPERQSTYDEVKSKVELKFKVPAQEKRTREWEQELKKDAKIEIIEAGFGVQGSAVGR